MRRANENLKFLIINSLRYMKPSCIYEAWTEFYRKRVISKKALLEIKYVIAEVEKTSTGTLEDSVK